MNGRTRSSFKRHSFDEIGGVGSAAFMHGFRG
jgi:hypothetical protein